MSQNNLKVFKADASDRNYYIRANADVRELSPYLFNLDILFSSNHNIHKSSCGLCFWASDPLIDRFYLNLSIKGSEAKK